MKFRSLALTLVWVVLAHAAGAASIWDETLNGDLSNDRANPTLLTPLSIGSNTISGTVTQGERDYFRFNVPTGYTLNQIFLTVHSPANTSFFAIQSGTQITVDPTAPTAGPLLGYVHTGGGLVGTDVLDDMATSNLLVPPAQGFALPLGPGDYSFWMQQTSAILTSYAFDVIIAPEPTTAALFGLGLASLAIARRRSAQRR
jgi:hypothetical protein